MQDKAEYKKLKFIEFVYKLPHKNYKKMIFENYIYQSENLKEITRKQHAQEAEKIFLHSGLAVLYKEDDK